MKKTLSIAVLGVLAGALSAWAQAGPGAQAPAQIPAAPSTGTAAQASQRPQDRAGAYYYFTLGHLQEQQYDITSSADTADQAIESYKKALELDPGSSVIMERLAETYAKSQHLRDAVVQAQESLKADPDNVDAHRLLARIYVHELGDLNSGDVENENLAKAVEQFEDVLKLEPDDTYSALWLARLYGFQNQQAKGEQVLRGVLQKDPENEPALEQLSQLLIDEGRPQEAIDLLTRAADEDSSPDLYDWLGEAYLHAKDYPKAEEAYQKAVQADPDDTRHRHGLAQALMSQDKYAEALEQFQKLSQLEPSTAENYLRMAQLDRHLGKFDDAESNLMRAKQLAPGNMEIEYNEALLYEDQGRYSDAEKVFADAIAGIKAQNGGEGNPDALAILYEQLGRAYREQHNYPSAIETYEDMGKLSPDAQNRARLLLIDTYRASHDLDRAITEAKKGLDLTPKDHDLTVTLALLYGEKSDTAQATDLLHGLLQGNNNDQEIYLDIAQVQERGRKFADAEQSAEKAEQLASEPTDKANAWLMLGSIYERQKKFDQAEQQFRKVLAVSPDSAPVLNDYGYMLADRGIRVEEATSMIERAVKQEPTNGAYLDSLGWAYYKEKKFAEAEEYLRKAVDREGEDPTILSHLASVYLKLGDDQQAAQLYEKSLAQWQKALPADYEPDQVSEVEAQLKNLKKRLAEKSTPETAKPQ